MPCADLIDSDDVVACCAVDQYDEHHPPSDDLLATAVSVASHVAWALAGRQHGACTVVGERPGRPNMRCRCARRYCGCACGPSSVVWLGNSPVQTVDEVRVGGAVIEADGYALIEAATLVRYGDDPWPACQHLDAAADSPDVLTVDYTWGVPVDAAARRAIGLLGCEVLKACAGDRTCALPSNVASVSRQGVSIDVLDPFEFITEGRTGVYEFDLWLSTVNPNRLMDAPTVRTPDLLRPVVPR